MLTLQTLVRRICAMYPDDALAPSVVTSWVKDAWYVSVARWIGPRNEMTRKVLFHVADDDLETAYAEALRRLS